MGFQHLDVPVPGIKAQGRMFDQADQDIDAQRKIAAADDGHAGGGGGQFDLLGLAEPGRTDHQGGAAPFGAGPGQGDRGVRGGEIDDNVAQAEIGGLAPVEPGGDHHVLAGIQNLRHGATHPTPGPRNPGVEQGGHAVVSFDPGPEPAGGESPPRISAQKRLAVPAKFELRGL